MEDAKWRSLPADQLSRRIVQYAQVIAKDTSKSCANALNSATQLLSGLLAYGPHYELPTEATAALFTALTSHKVPPLLQLLCANILTHSSPSNITIHRMSSALERTAVHLLLHVIQAQHHRPEIFLQHIPSIITYIYDNDAVSRATICFLTSTSVYHIRSLEQSHVEQVTELLSQSMMHTSNQPPEKQRGVFSGQQEPFVEMDGTEVIGAFTPLCFGKSYGGDHLMSIACFSVANTWLRHIYVTEAAIQDVQRSLSTDSEPVLTEDVLRQNFDAIVDTRESIRRSFPIEELDIHSGANDTLAHAPAIAEEAGEGDDGDGGGDGGGDAVNSGDGDDGMVDVSVIQSPSAGSISSTHAHDDNDDDEDDDGSGSGGGGGGGDAAVNASVFSSHAHVRGVVRGMGLRLQTPIVRGSFATDAPDFLLSEDMKDELFAYCIRIIDQCCIDVPQEKFAAYVQSGDIALRQAVAKQAIDTLATLAGVHPEVVPAAKSYIDRLLARFASIPQKALYEPHLLLSLVSFFVAYGEHIAFDLHALFDSFFESVLGVRFADPRLCLDTISMLMEHRTALLNTRLFPVHFPTILRILAWHPKAFVEQFVVLIPLMSNQYTFVELLHLVFDLPCLSAALVQLRAAGGQEALVNDASNHDANASALYTFILRTKGGLCETIDKLDALHALTAPQRNHPIVQGCAEVAPLFARIILDTVLKHASESDVKALVPVLIERVVALYPISSFQQEMRALMAEYVLKVFHRHPGLIVDLKSDILGFIRNRNNAASGGEEFFVHLVWIIGEHASPLSDPRCTTDLMVIYHEELEAFVGEVNSMLQHGPGNINPAFRVVHTTRLMNILMMALAKLATRCPEVLARVSLFLTKIARSHMESKAIVKSSRHAVIERATLLLHILKQPAIAAAVLSEPPPIITEPTASANHFEPSGTLAILRTCRSFASTP
ncbi:hypothetical protein PTSG_02995 [Salpingoeca rosetta]|uniref:Uncharacterized protein n=1 Tax=Salpingoeca rosetta (strain ATCC 50818 / BSB-021) TaxID=946362 RepID=F2U3Y8_SALR5|nr:uncharacterized protein PTSG_02995 [Salpingoeca rosetta]EGD82332.1 hypothetical protein PTSG_02995 [Salpingoeca rosetta]|eukprot:XP_004996515.1 hypothetical protein PTSG_02995 [Salpingoeca rosetta]